LQAIVGLKQKGGECADAGGIATSQEPLMADSPIDAILRLPLADPPSELQLQVLPVTSADELEPARGYRWWDFGEAALSQLPLETQQTLELTLEPGLYVLSVSAWWQEYGDVVYGFLIQVQ
jgi:hypothetical protein